MQSAILTLFFSFSILFSLLGQNKNLLRCEIDKFVYIDFEIDFERTPGFILGVIEKDSSFIFPYGSLSKKNILLPSATDLFEIGSLTNLFTATLIKKLDSENIISIDSSINKYLPERLYNKSTKAITIRHLLSHTSGLPRLPVGIGKTEKNNNQPYAHYTKEMLEDYYKNYQLDSDVFEKYSFSNLGYAILELAIEYATREKFEELLKREMKLWGLNSTSLHLDGAEKQKLVQGFDKAHSPSPPREYASFGGAVGLKSNMNDMLRFLRLNIDSNLFDNLHEVQFPTEIRKNTSVGQGWHIINHKKYYPIVLHIGATNGYRAYIAFVKETRTGVIVLSNSEFALRGLGYSILELMNGGFRKKRK